jgi:hypothetical protein
MKTWPHLCALLLFAACLQANAATSERQVNVGELVDRMQQAMAERCAQAGARAGKDPVHDQLDHDLSCTCAPQAVDIAYPPASRAGSTSASAFMARTDGAMKACVARSVGRVIDEPCAHGTDPFADDESPTPVAPAVAKAHCQCARSALDKAAATNPRKDADAATARYKAGQVAADEKPAAMRLLIDIQKTCAPDAGN